MPNLIACQTITRDECWELATVCATSRTTGNTRYLCAGHATPEWPDFVWMTSLKGFNGQTGQSVS